AKPQAASPWRSIGGKGHGSGRAQPPSRPGVGFEAPRPRRLPMKFLVPLLAAALIGAAPAALAQTGTESAPPATNLPAAPPTEVETPDFIAQVAASNAF